MSNLKLGLAQMSTPEKVQFARRLAGVMDEYGGLFPNMPVSFDGLSDQVNWTEDAFNGIAAAREAVRGATSQLRNTEGVLDLMLMAVASCVQGGSKGDAALIQLMGFELARPALPIGPLPAPEELRAAEGNGAGAVALRWQPLRGAYSYEVQGREVTGPEAWQLAGRCTRAKWAMPGLRSGARYAFRVRAIGSAGLSPWSVPVERVAT